MIAISRIARLMTWLVCLGLPVTLVASETQYSAEESKDGITLPNDHGSHSSSTSEWWYYTGHLNAANHNTYGFELSFFRTLGQVFFVHMALTDEAANKFVFSRQLVSASNVSTSPDRAQLRYGTVAALDQLSDNEFRAWAKFEDVTLDIVLKQQKAPLFVNGTGLIDMPAGGTSWYYSLTRLAATGTVAVGGETTDVTGLAWMDHQWGNFMVGSTGWDWFSFQMDDGNDYNLFSFRDANDRTTRHDVNILDPQANRSRTTNEMNIERLTWWKSPHTGGNYVTKWRITLPDRQETFVVEATMQDQEMYRRNFIDRAPEYWEGRMLVTRTDADGTVVKGLGYSEHFPYQTQVP